MIETIATLITVFCGIFSMIITACTIRAPYSKTVANVLKTLLIKEFNLGIWIFFICKYRLTAIILLLTTFLS